MKNTRCSIIILLIGTSFFIEFKANAQSPIVKPEKYSVLSFRLGTSIVREFGFYMNPVVKKHPEFTFGLGYRSKSGGDLTDDCFTLNPIGKVINKPTAGPYILFGFDFKNKLGVRRVVNPSIVVQIRRLKAEKLEFYGCIDKPDFRHHDFDVKTFDVNSKFFLDIGGSESFADFYFGAGFGIRYAKNFLHEIDGNPANITERLVLPLFSFDLGIRLSFMGAE